MFLKGTAPVILTAGQTLWWDPAGGPGCFDIVTIDTSVGEYPFILHSFHFGEIETFEKLFIEILYFIPIRTELVVIVEL